MSSEISGAALSKLTIAGTALLIALVLYFGVTSGMTNPVVLLIMIIPISLTLPGQIRGSSRVFQWLCFVVLFYLMLGILLSLSGTYTLLGLGISLVCLLLFISAIIFIRSKRKLNTRTDSTH